MIKNYQILKESIKGVISNSGLDLGAVYFILKDIFNEIEVMYYTKINEELMEESKVNKNEEEENNIENK